MNSRSLRRGLWMLGLLLVLLAQAVHTIMAAGQVRIVVYNEGPDALVDLRLACTGDEVSWPELEVDSSRNARLDPIESPAVLAVSWSAAGGRAERAWPVEAGDRWTVRVRSDLGVVEATHARSLGRRAVDFFRSLTE